MDSVGVGREGDGDREAKRQNGRARDIQRQTYRKTDRTSSRNRCRNRNYEPPTKLTALLLLIKSSLLFAHMDNAAAPHSSTLKGIHKFKDNTGNSTWF